MIPIKAKGGIELANELIERIESESEIKTYIDRLKYALDHGAQINFQIERRVDEERAPRYTNKYTIHTLFPDEDPVIALKRELKTLTVQEYIKTVKDQRFKNRSEMRVFGKVYNSSEDVYIKIRVELLDMFGKGTTFVMSFHFAEEAFKAADFPYRKKE